MHAPFLEEPDFAMDFIFFGGCWLFPVGGGDFCFLFVFFGGIVQTVLFVEKWEKIELESYVWKVETKCESKSKSNPGCGTQKSSRVGLKIGQRFQV